MKNKSIGIIAEDISDVNTIKILIKRISNKNVSEKHHLGYGCGKIVSKCQGWARSLYSRNCRLLIVLHDSDSNSSEEIYKRILVELKGTQFSNYLICIPTQELEAWLLSDPLGIKNAMNLKVLPKIKGNPQSINSPKEYLGNIVSKSSNKTIIYLNTKHNEAIATQTTIDEIYKKCESFRPFRKFITDNVS